MNTFLIILTTTSSGGTSILPAIFGGAGVAIVGLVWRIVNRLRFGKIEDEAITTRNAKAAVEAVGDALEDLRKERIESKQRIRDLEDTISVRESVIHAHELKILTLESSLRDLTERMRSLEIRANEAGDHSKTG